MTKEQIPSEKRSHANDQMDDRNYHIRGTLATQFIEKIDCLDGPGLVDAPSNLIDEHGYPVPIRIDPQVTVDYD